MAKKSLIERNQGYLSRIQEYESKNEEIPIFLKIDRRNLGKRISLAQNTWIYIDLKRFNEKYISKDGKFKEMSKNASLFLTGLCMDIDFELTEEGKELIRVRYGEEDKTIFEADGEHPSDTYEFEMDADLIGRLYHGLHNIINEDTPKV